VKWTDDIITIKISLAQLCVAMGTKIVGNEIISVNIINGEFVDSAVGRYANDLTFANIAGIADI